MRDVTVNDVINVVTAVTAVAVFSTLTSLSKVECISLAPVYWNHSNPIFKISKNDHIIDVHQFDDIDFICPFYDVTSGIQHRRHHEYYVIYRVSRSEYDSCNVLADNALMILNCSSPLQRRRFTILFEPFQSIPNVPEYKPGQSYYFISTSSGASDGLSNKYQGACYYYNMKLTVRVCCAAPTPSIYHDGGRNNDLINPYTAPPSDDFLLPWQPAPEHDVTSSMVLRDRVTSSPSHRTTGRRKFPITPPHVRHHHGEHRSRPRMSEDNYVTASARHHVTYPRDVTNGCVTSFKLISAFAVVLVTLIKFNFIR